MIMFDSEAFFTSAERDINKSLTLVDDHLARVDNEMEAVSI